MTATSRVVWCDRGWIPYCYGFCPDEAAWKHEVKRLGVPHLTYPTADAMCTQMESKITAYEGLTLITVNHKKRSPQFVISLLVHEAMHVWREMCVAMGERSPSSEFEAYAMQNIVHHLIGAYEQTRGKLCRA